jgi:hypothetical protein
LTALNILGGLKMKGALQSAPPHLTGVRGVKPRLLIRMMHENSLWKSFYYFVVGLPTKGS